MEGARFMDRLQPMKGEVLSADVWGADSVRPRLVDNGIELAGTSFWGGNILREPDGKYHLFVCGWPENSPKEMCIRDSGGTYQRRCGRIGDGTYGGAA